MNEKGSSLLVVLLISLIFSVLGLAVLGAAVNNVKRTEIREAEIETTANAKVLMSEVVAKLQESLNTSAIETELKESDIPTAIYNSQISQAISNTVNSFTGVTINDNDEIYKKYGISDVISFKKDNFLRIYEIKIDSSDSDNPAIKRTVTQNVIFSPTPSFLNYAIGAYGKTESNDPIKVGDEIGVDGKGNKILRESDSALIINGSPDIIGNVFAPTLELNSKAEYRDVDETDSSKSRLYTTGSFDGPSIFGTLYISKLNNNRKNTETINRLRKPFYEGTYSEKDMGIIGVPALKPTINNFVDMDFTSTFNLKWDDTGLPNFIKEPSKVNSFITTCGNNDDLFKALINTDGLVENYHSATGSIDDLYKIADGDTEIRYGDVTKNRAQNPKFSCGNNFGKKGNQQIYLIEESMLETYKGSATNLYQTDLDHDRNLKTLFFTNIDKDVSGTIFKNDHVLTLNQGIDLQDSNGKGWLVVNGDLEINGGSDTAPIVIKGNILVNGNLYIKSATVNKEYLEFDSTVYVTGNSIIENVNISGAEDGTDQKQLVLISNGDLKIVRINEYEKVENPEGNSLVNLINDKDLLNLKAFFYTDKTAILYGVGSHFQIEGGVFARQQLTINAIRYNFDENKIDNAEYAQYDTQPDARSRFYVEYDNRVITDQLSSLPRVNRLQVIVDDLIID